MASTLSPDLVRTQVSAHAPFSALKAPIQEIKIGDCVRNGQVLVNLLVTPPADWSTLRLPYSLWLTLPVDGASAAVISGQELRELPKLVRRLMARAEADPDLLAFIERFGVSLATIDRGPDQRLEVKLFGAGEKPWPSITFSDGPQAEQPGFVRAYRIPRMGGLPARRELLRVLEVLSAEHPRCRPEKIEAERQNSADGKAEEWFVRMDTEGEGCPATFALHVGPDGKGVRLPSAQEAKGGTLP